MSARRDPKQSNDNLNSQIFAEEAEKKAARSKNKRSKGHPPGAENTTTKKDSSFHAAGFLVVPALVVLSILVLFLVRWRDSKTFEKSRTKVRGEILSSQERGPG